MSYQVLARKWRPKTFDAVVGQEHVVRALSNALQLNRLHHAYLFSGTRGVGKTTLARILAKCLNCEKGLTATPCGQCSSCTHIDQGKFVDLVEVDAASRTGIDDMRELLDNVQYLPAVGRFKIYLIDEVHMLSTNSFNALLKTLEEPPKHVKFFFATTHPQRLPVTILSRCLQFNLIRLIPSELKQHLMHLLESESVPFEELAVHQIALSAEGSVRDALSLLDQAIAYGDGELKLAEVEAMLGIASHGCVTELLRRIVQNESGPLLEKIAMLYARAVNFENLLGDVIVLLHEIAVYQAASVTDLSGRFKAEEVTAFAEMLTPEDVQLFYQIALQGRRDLPVLPDPKDAFEMTMLRMLSFKPLTNADNTENASSSTSKVSQVSSKNSVNPLMAESSAECTDRKPVVTSSVMQTQAPTTASAAASPEEAVEIKTTNVTPMQLDAFVGVEGWIRLIDLLQLQDSVRQLCYGASLTVNSPSEVCLTVDPQFESLCSSEREAEIEEAFKRFFGRQIVIRIKVGVSEEEIPAQRYQRQAYEQDMQVRKLIESNPQIKELQKQMGATIVPGSIKPSKSDAG